MTDKLKTTLMNQPEFAAGELPTASKFNASFEQLRFALERLERALGDMTDYTAANRALSADNLHQYSLGRSVGANGIGQSLLDAKTNFIYEDTLQLGRNEWFLPYIPRGTNYSLAYAITASTATNRLGSDVFVTDVTPNIPAAPGEYFYDSTNNKIVSFLHLIGGTATFSCTSFIDAERSYDYLYSPSLGHERQNVFPPQHMTATFISVSTSSNTNYGYIVSMNPARPLYSTPIDSTDFSRASTADLNSEGTARKVTFGLNPFRTTTNLVSYKLPSSLSTYAEHNQIPSGHLYLYNDGNNDTILTGTYYYRDETSVYYKGITLNTAATSRYRLVNHGGVSHAEALEALRWDMQFHEHKGPRAIDHDSLRNLGGKVNTGINSHMGRGWWRPTVPASHPHPQYLNRYGWSEGYDTANLCNMMQGHIYIAASSTNAAHQTYAQALGDSTTTSFRLHIGGTDKYLMVDKYTTDNYLTVRSPHLVLGATGVFAFEESTNVFVACVADTPSIFASTATDIFVSCVGSLNHLSYNAEKVSINLVSKNATNDVLALSTGVQIQGVLEDSYLTVAGGNNVAVSALGKIQATIINSTNRNYELVSTVLNTSNLAVPFSGPGKYAYYDNYAIDGARRRTKVYHPHKWMMLETDTAAGWVEYNWITSANVPKYRVRSTDSANGIYITGTAFDAAVYLDLEEDCYVQEIQLGLAYDNATLKLYRCLLNGSAIEATSSALPTMNGSSTTITWTLGTQYGVMGQRYPTAQNTAIDLLLVVENVDLDSGTHFQVHMGKCIYYQMRS